MEREFNLLTVISENPINSWKFRHIFLALEDENDDEVAGTTKEVDGDGNGNGDNDRSTHPYNLFNLVLVLLIFEQCFIWVCIFYFKTIKYCNLKIIIIIKFNISFENINYYFKLIWI